MFAYVRVIAFAEAKFLAEPLSEMKKDAHAYFNHTGECVSTQVALLGLIDGDKIQLSSTLYSMSVSRVGTIILRNCIHIRDWHGVRSFPTYLELK